MCRFILSFLLFLLSNSTPADTLCTLVYDPDDKTFLVNEGICNDPISPASTFKIPLSLMGYDSGYLSNLELPELPFRAEYVASLASHKHPTSPAYWMKNSVVWYSQLLTEWLGMARLQHYVAQFDYGNQDLSGDAGKNNGLTRAWLSSSLKITPLQQLIFLQKLLDHDLAVTEEAYAYTEQLLKQDNTDMAYQIYGKTGSVVAPVDSSGKLITGRQLGWFVGWVQKSDKKLIFVNIINEPKLEGVYSGPKAKEDILKRLPKIVANY